jgi:hypothetical protein
MSLELRTRRIAHPHGRGPNGAADAGAGRSSHGVPYVSSRSRRCPMGALARCPCHRSRRCPRLRADHRGIGGCSSPCQQRSAPSAFLASRELRAARHTPTTALATQADSFYPSDKDSHLARRTRSCQATQRTRISRAALSRLPPWCSSAPHCAHAGRAGGTASQCPPGETGDQCPDGGHWQFTA